MHILIDNKSGSPIYDQIYTQIIRGDLLHITVRDYTDGFEDAVIFDQVIPVEDTEYRDIFTEEMEALWQGIK